MGKGFPMDRTFSAQKVFIQVADAYPIQSIGVLEQLGDIFRPCHVRRMVLVQHALHFLFLSGMGFHSGLQNQQILTGATGDQTNEAGSDTAMFKVQAIAAAADVVIGAGV